MWPFKKYKDPTTMDLPSGQVCIFSHEYANLLTSTPVFRWAQNTTCGAMDCVWHGRSVFTIYKTSRGNFVQVSQSLEDTRDTLNGVLYGNMLTEDQVKDAYFSACQSARIDKSTKIIFDNLQYPRTEI